MRLDPEVKEERRAWLRQYVADNPDKALYRVAEAAKYHRGWEPSNAEIKAARVAVGLSEKPTGTYRVVMAVTQRRVARVKRRRLIRLRAIALYGHDPELRP